MVALLGELHMFKLLHQQSGGYLFTHQWKWILQAHAEDVYALVMSFTQFAREIDGGEVVRVHFDPSQNDEKDRHSSSSCIQLYCSTNELVRLQVKCFKHFYCEFCNGLEKGLSKSWRNYSCSYRRVRCPRWKSAKPLQLHFGDMKLSSIVNCCCSSVVTSGYNELL
uniref:Uncharacterized protein n=1 Tax=Hyaloperonospora arabidopsidis (strain Emoy2) TaxID=559515 RepID=M4BKU6_HYAAE